MKKKFKKFMKEQGAWDKWKANLNKRKREIFKSRPYDYIANAFLWDDSPEGHRYWSDLNEIWSHLI